MADIARETGLTLGTVSRALNESVKYPISPKTRKRVMDAATRLGYRPNTLGKALAAGRSRLIMLLTPDPFAPYYAEINRFLSREAVQQGYSLLVSSTLPAESEEAIQSNDWLYGVDGIIVCDQTPAWDPYISEAIRLKIPAVSIGAWVPPWPIDSVVIELYKAAHDLSAHLHKVGCKAPALLTSTGSSRNDPRTRAYYDAAEEYGYEPRIISDWVQTRTQARQAAAEAYREQPFDALICINDLVAMGALRGLADVGARVPEDVKLAGCDGLEESLFQLVPITTLVQPLQESCHSAWDLLQKLMKGSVHPPKSIIKEATIEIRASTMA